MSDVRTKTKRYTDDVELQRDDNGKYRKHQKHDKNEKHSRHGKHYRRDKNGEFAKHGKHSKKSSSSTQDTTMSSTSESASELEQSFEEFNEKERKMEAPIQWHTVDFDINLSVRATDFKKANVKTKKLETIDGGQIRLIERPLTSIPKEFELHHGKRSHRNDFVTNKGAREARHNDIACKVTLEKATSDISDPFYIELTSIRALEDEGFTGADGDVRHLSYLVQPGELHATKPTTLVLLPKRKMTVAAAQFRNDFPDITVESLKKHLQELTPTECLVPYNSPIVAYHNEYEDEEITNGDVINKDAKLKHQRVKMAKALGKKYQQMAIERLTKSVSEANITGPGFTVLLSLKPTAERQALHELWLDTKGKEGYEFCGFGDLHHSTTNPIPLTADLGKASGEMTTLLSQRQDRRQYLNGTLRIEYMTDQVIEIDLSEARENK